jgi:hypothetical protein
VDPSLQQVEARPAGFVKGLPGTPGNVGFEMAGGLRRTGYCGGPGDGTTFQASASSKPSGEALSAATSNAHGVCGRPGAGWWTVGAAGGIEMELDWEVRPWGSWHVVDVDAG